jgi:hypothetical protein
MPIPDPGCFRPMKFVAPPGVTEKEAKQAQLAAVYGVTMPVQQLSETEVANLRAILAQHDSEHKPMVTMDLNNPPKAPYRYQPFPKMIYDLNASHAARDERKPRELASGGVVMETVHIPAKVVTRRVESQEELDAALAEGWSQQAPNFTAEQEIPLKAAYAAEAGQIDEEIERRRPGRPRKTDA